MVWVKSFKGSGLKGQESGVGVWDRSGRFPIGSRPIRGKRFADAAPNDVFRNIDSNPRAKSRHNMPVARFHQHTSDKRPLSAHARLHRMDRTQFVPEYTVSVFALRENRSAAGHPGIRRDKAIGGLVNIVGDSVDIGFGQNRAAVTLAAVAAHGAFENIGRFHFWDMLRLMSMARLSVI